MHRNKQFTVVNAFAKTAFGGNPAAVFTEADGMDDKLMLAMARQLNLVETVFVFEETNDADFRLRYFTPTGEIPVAGHPTIAAWRALIHKNIIDIAQRRSYVQVNQAGRQTIEIEIDESGDPIVVMKQPPPKFLDARCSVEDAALVFGLQPVDFHADLPIRAVDVGLGHFLVPVRNIEALFRVKRMIEPLRNLCYGAGVREAQVFCFESMHSSADMHTRNLCPREGIEDPACGNGNGALSAYLAEYCWPDKSDFSLKIEQGNIVEMPSVIHTRSVRTADGIETYIGGSGVVMLDGQFLV